LAAVWQRGSAHRPGPRTRGSASWAGREARSSWLTGSPRPLIARWSDSQARRGTVEIDGTQLTEIGHPTRHGPHHCGGCRLMNPRSSTSWSSDSPRVGTIVAWNSAPSTASCSGLGVGEQYLHRRPSCLPWPCSPPLACRIHAIRARRMNSSSSLWYRAASSAPTACSDVCSSSSRRQHRGHSSTVGQFWKLSIPGLDICLLTRRRARGLAPVGVPRSRCYARAAGSGMGPVSARPAAPVPARRLRADSAAAVTAAARTGTTPHSSIPARAP
jgi:hypothetical protein